MVDAPGQPVVGVAPRKRVWAWALWDWATQPFNSIILTFVFSALYLVSDSFIDPEIAALGKGDPAYEAALADLASQFAWGGVVAGLLIFIIAPVLGQRSDARGRRKASLGMTTILLVITVACLFFVQPAPTYFLLGVALISLGEVLSEIAGVNYNAMIVQVSTPSTMGRISGLGWGLGYMGGIVALILVVVAQQAGLLPDNDGLAYRYIALGCALWIVIFAWPLFKYVPEAPPSDRPRVGIIRGYVILAKDLKVLWVTARSTLWFLLASAIYRDGLAGIFKYGAIIASIAFGFTPEMVIAFGIAANLIAGISTFIAGRFDDRLGPRRVILMALGLIIASGLAVVFFRDVGDIVFWIGGLTLSAMVGPAQSASRSLLARLSPPGSESEIFGLYATTGRAASFLAPVAWVVAIAIFGATIWGTLGVIFIVAIGFVLMLFVRTPADQPVGQPAQVGSA